MTRKRWRGFAGQPTSASSLRSTAWDGRTRTVVECGGTVPRLPGGIALRLSKDTLTRNGRSTAFAGEREGAAGSVASSPAQAGAFEPQEADQSTLFPRLLQGEAPNHGG